MSTNIVDLTLKYAYSALIGFVVSYILTFILPSRRNSGNYFQYDGSTTINNFFYPDNQRQTFLLMVEKIAYGLILVLVFLYVLFSFMKSPQYSVTILEYFSQILLFIYALLLARSIRNNDSNGLRLFFFLQAVASVILRLMLSGINKTNILQANNNFYGKYWFLVISSG